MEQPAQLDKQDPIELVKVAGAHERKGVENIEETTTNSAMP
jgi:hypothetical protein